MPQSAANQNSAAVPEDSQPEAEPTALTLVDGQGTPTNGQAPALSLKALSAALTDRGIEMPYSSLAQFVALGDIAEQLGVGGKGNRREFPRWSVDFLADFLTWYTTAGIKKELAPDAVRHRLAQFRSSDEFRSSQNSITSEENPGSNQISTFQNSKTPSDVTFYEPAQPTDIAGPIARFLGSLLSPLTRLPAAMDNVADAIRELRGDKAAAPAAPSIPVPTPNPGPPIEDTLLTAEEAAVLLRCSPRSVSRLVPPVLPRRWRNADVVLYIRGLEPRIKEEKQETLKQEASK